MKELVQQNLSIKDNKVLYVSGEIVSYPLDKELISEGYNVKQLINYSVKHNENLDLSFFIKLPYSPDSIIWPFLLK